MNTALHILLYVGVVSSGSITHELKANSDQPNSKPTVEAGADQTVEASTRVTLEGEAHDSDGEIVRVLWWRPAGIAVTLSDPRALHTTFRAPFVTETTKLRFRLSVTDDDGANASDTVTITVTPVRNHNPTVHAGADQTVEALTKVTLEGEANDVDGDIVEYRWQQTAGKVVELSDPQRLSTTFHAPLVSETTELAFQLSVTDDDGANASDTVTITVTPVRNHNPTVHAGADQTVEALTKVTLEGEANDVDGDIVQYRWQQTAGKAVELSDPQRLSTTFHAPLVSETTELAFQLSVTDDDDATASDSINITVNAVRSVKLNTQTIVWESAVNVGRLTRTIALTNPNSSLSLDVAIVSEKDWLTLLTDTVKLDAGETEYVAVYSECEEVGEWTSQLLISDAVGTTTIDVSNSCDSNFDNDAFSEHAHLVMDELLEDPGYTKALVGEVAYSGLGVRVTAPVSAPNWWNHLDTPTGWTGRDGNFYPRAFQYTTSLVGNMQGVIVPKDKLPQSVESARIYDLPHVRHLYRYQYDVNVHDMGRMPSMGSMPYVNGMIFSHLRYDCETPGMQTLVVKIHLTRKGLPIVDKRLSETLFEDDFYVKWDVECVPVSSKRLTYRIYQGTLTHMASYEDGKLDFVFRPETGMVIPNKPSVIEIEKFVSRDEGELEIDLYHSSEQIIDLVKIRDERVETDASHDLEIHRTAFELPAELNKPETELDIRVIGGLTFEKIRTHLYNPIEPTSGRDLQPARVQTTSPPIHITWMYLRQPGEEEWEVPTTRLEELIERLIPVMPFQPKKVFHDSEPIVCESADKWTSSEDVINAGKDCSKQLGGYIPGRFHLAIFNNYSIDFLGATAFAYLPGNLQWYSLEVIRDTPFLFDRRWLSNSVWVLAHEFGHNLYLGHTPCSADGAGDRYYYYPYELGTIGEETFWRYYPGDLKWRRFSSNVHEENGVLYELMSYCARSYRGFARYSYNIMTEYLQYLGQVYLEEFGHLNPISNSELLKDVTTMLAFDGQVLRNQVSGKHFTTSRVRQLKIPTQALRFTRPSDIMAELVDQRSGAVLAQSPVKTGAISHTELHTWEAMFAPPAHSEVTLRIRDRYNNVVLEENAYDKVRRAMAELPSE